MDENKVTDEKAVDCCSYDEGFGDGYTKAMEHYEKDYDKGYDEGFDVGYMKGVEALENDYVKGYDEGFGDGLHQRKLLSAYVGVVGVGICLLAKSIYDWKKTRHNKKL